MGYTPADLRITDKSNGHSGHPDDQTGGAADFVGGLVEETEERCSGNQEGQRGADIGEERPLVGQRGALDVQEVAWCGSVVLCHGWNMTKQPVLATQKAGCHAAAGRVIKPHMDILIATASAADPYVPGPIEGLDVAGPVLTFLRDQPCDAVWLDERGNPSECHALRVAIHAKHPALAVEILSGLEVLARIDRADAASQQFTLLVGDIVPSFETAYRLSTAGLEFRLAALTDTSPTGEPIFAVRTFRAERAGGTMREPRAGYAAALPEGGLLGSHETPRKKTARDPADVARRIGLVGEHRTLVAELEKIAAVASHPFPLLIVGETGAGKGMLARYVHELSDRCDAPFVAVNCAAVPEQLVESILFGHVKGAFTGAASDQLGKFALADGGTLFLDEIGEMPLALQPKLLKVLEDGMVEPVGAGKGHQVNVRVIAATNRDLQRDIASKTFREDLYYRLAFVTATMPPLRERRSDIHLIALHILQRFNGRLKEPRQLAVDALRRLEQAEWRGNVRDLENVVGRSVLMSRHRVVRADDLLFDQVTSPPPPAHLPEPQEGFSLEEFLREARDQLIRRALDKCDGRQSAAARLLGLSPQAVSHYLRRTDA